MAVYTQIDDADLTVFLQDYAIGALRSFKGIAAGVQNSNFLVHSTQGRYILTLYESETTSKSVPFFLSLMHHFAAQGIKCPLPITRKDGGLLSTLCGKPAALVSFLDGVSVSTPTPAHCAAMGSALAALHLAGQGFSHMRENNIGHAYWADLFARNRPRTDEIMPGLAAEIEDELKRLAAQWPQDLPRGIIHADLFPDNAFFLEGAVSGIIDFYFACTDFYAYDVAICLNAWCFEADANFNITKARHFLDGYQQMRPLLRAEYDALPVLAGGAAMRFLLTRVHDWLNHTEDAFVVRKNPTDYLRRLRFHKNVTHSRDYGLEVL